MLVLAFVLVVASCVVVAAAVGARLRGVRRLEELLARRGLQLASDPFATQLELRSPDGVRARRLTAMALGSATPLTAPGLQRCSVVETPMPVADVVICRHGIAQAVFGPFLPPRIATGDATFDAEFGVFEPPSAPGAYRGTAPGGGLPWARPDVLADLRACGFLAMQVTGGAARIATDEARGRASKAPLLHQLDTVDLARRLRGVATDSRAPALPVPTGAAPTAPAFSPWEMGGVMAVEIALMMVRMAPQLFGLDGLVCPNGGVFEDRRRSTVCRLSPTSTYRPELGSLTALVIAIAIAIVAGRVA